LPRACFALSRNPSAEVTSKNALSAWHGSGTGASDDVNNLSSLLKTGI
jgi:hypothetical protein